MEDPNTPACSAAAAESPPLPEAGGGSRAAGAARMSDRMSDIMSAEDFTAMAAQIDAEVAAANTAVATAARDTVFAGTFAIPGTPAKPPRATRAANLTTTGLPATFEAIVGECAVRPPSPAMSNNMVDDLIWALEDGQSARRRPLGQKTLRAVDPQARTAHEAPSAYSSPDVEDRLSAVQDVLADLETNLGSVDGMVAEVATAVDSVTEDLSVLKDSVNEGIEGLREEIFVLSASVGSLHSNLADMKALLEGLAKARGVVV